MARQIIHFALVLLLLEWTARTPGAAVYDGGAPRELFRIEQMFLNHNGSQIGFDPTG